MADIERLYQKFLQKKCTREEAEALLRYFEQQPDAEFMQRLIADELEKPEAFSVDPADLKTIEENRNRLRATIRLGHRTAPTRRLAFPYWAAAAVLLLIGTVGIWRYQHSDGQPPLTSVYGGDVLPGTSRAILILSDGSTVALDESKEGIIASADQLTYNDGEIVSQELRDVEYATLTTPRGGQYKVTLPDGSRVWLNAESSLQYPVAFDGRERRVILLGEGFFEVTRNERQPFIVQSREQSLEVLGTSFNVNAYTEEPYVTTTLISGSVRIKPQETEATATLIPGQQAAVSGSISMVDAVDVREFTAWKDGRFHYNATDITTVLRQLERWYDLEIDYRNVPDRKLHAVIDRDKKLSTVLYAIEKTSGIKFNIGVAK